MASLRSVSLFFLLAIMCLTVKLAIGEDTEVLINKICRQMEDFGFCYKTFHQNLHTPSPDLKTLARITIDQSITNASNSHEVAAKLLHDAKEGPYKYSLMACENAYALILSQFQDASDFFDRGDYQSVADAERIMPRAIGSCTSYYDTPPYPPNPLAERNTQMRILVTMSIITVNYLVNP